MTKSSISSKASYRSCNEEDNKKEIGWVQVCIALIRSMVGTSAFTISATFSKSGYLWGGIQMVACGIFSFISLQLLFVCADKKENFSYQSLVANKLGKVCFFFLNMMVLGAEFFSLLKGISSALTLFGLILDWSQWILTIAIGVFVLLSTLAKNNILIPKTGQSILNIFNYTNLIILFYFIVTVIVQTCQRSKSDVLTFDFIGTFGTFSKALVSYSGQTNLLDILSKVKSEERKKIPLAIGFATGLTCFFYLVVGGLGYLTFGQTFPNSNLLAAYGSNDSTMVFICIIASIVLVLVYLHFKIKPLKDVLELIFTRKIDSVKGFWRFALYSLAVVVACLIVIFWESVDTIAELVKAILEPGTIFVFPLLLYRKVTFKLKSIWGFWNLIIVLMYLLWASLNIFCYVRSDLGFCSS